MSAVPVTRERVVSTPRYRVVSRRKPAVMQVVMVRIIVFFATMSVAYAGSTLVGMVGMEQARNNVRLATVKAQNVAERSRILKAEVDSLKDFDAIGRWAVANGFVAPGQNLVAMKTQQGGEGVSHAQ